MRIGLDAANGSAWSLAKSIFDALGAKTYVIHAEPDGLNINNGCGSTHIESLCELVKENTLMPDLRLTEMRTDAFVLTRMAML